MPIYPWLKNAQSKLQSFYLKHSIPHALLMIGPQNLGKSQLMQDWHLLLLCEKVNEAQACLHCKGCRWYQEGLHPDCIEIDAKVQQTAIEKIREIKETFHLSAHQAGFRILTIWNAQSLSPNSANALLKLVEEPPANTVINLVAENAYSLLPTLKSRCIQVTLNYPTFTQGLDWLKKNTQYPESLLGDTLALCSSPLEVISILEDESAKLTLGLIKDYFKDANVSVIPTQALITNLNLNGLYLLYYWIMRQIEAQLNDGERANVKGKLGFLSDVLKTIEQLKIAGINKQILLENLCYQWQGIGERI